MRFCSVQIKRIFPKLGIFLSIVGENQKIINKILLRFPVNSYGGDQRELMVT